MITSLILGHGRSLQLLMVVLVVPWRELMGDLRSAPAMVYAGGGASGAAACSDNACAMEYGDPKAYNYRPDDDAGSGGGSSSGTTSTTATTNTTSTYISYGALLADRVPCPAAGVSYYNPACNSSGDANPYTRGCSTITRCARDTG